MRLLDPEYCLGVGVKADTWFGFSLLVYGLEYMLKIILDPRSIIYHYYEYVCEYLVQKYLILLLS